MTSKINQQTVAIDRAPWSKEGWFEIALQPSAAALSAILLAREAFCEQFHLVPEANVLAIPVAHFPASEFQLSTCLRWIERLAASVRYLPVQFNNFSGNPPHQLFVRVVENSSQKQLKQALRQLADSMNQVLSAPMSLETKWRLPFIHQLPGILFNRAMHHFSELDFFVESAVASMIVIQLQPDGKPGPVVQQFTLNAESSLGGTPWYAPAQS
jgi:hypothetical protein